jgi:hypothetical protein
MSRRRYKGYGLDRNDVANVFGYIGVATGLGLLIWWATRGFRAKNPNTTTVPTSSVTVVANAQLPAGMQGSGMAPGDPTSSQQVAAAASS